MEERTTIYSYALLRLRQVFSAEAMPEADAVVAARDANLASHLLPDIFDPDAVLLYPREIQLWICNAMWCLSRFVSQREIVYSILEEAVEEISTGDYDDDDYSSDSTMRNAALLFTLAGWSTRWKRRIKAHI